MEEGGEVGLTGGEVAMSYERSSRVYGGVGLKGIVLGSERVGVVGCKGVEFR